MRRVEDRARARGFRVAHVDSKRTVLVPPPQRSANASPVTTVRLAPGHDGTDIEVESPNEQEARALLSDAREIEVVHPYSIFGWSDSLAAEVVSMYGASYVGSQDVALRVDHEFRLGVRVDNNHNTTNERAGRWSVWPMAGVGFTYGGGGLFFRPTLTLSFGYQETISPVRNREIPIGPHFAIEATAAGLIGGDGINGAEFQLTLREVEWFGLYGRVGHYWSDDPETAGLEWGFGIQTGTIPSFVLGVLEGISVGMLAAVFFGDWDL